MKAMDLRDKDSICWGFSLDVDNVSAGVNVF